MLQKGQVRQFLAEIGDPEKGNLKPFRELKVATRQHLTEVLTAIIYHASAFHAVQNNAQFDYFGFIPNKPLYITYQAIDDPDLSMEKIYASLPSTWVMMQQVVIAYTLGSDVEEHLENLDVLQDCLPKAHFGLKKDFLSLTYNIEKRNVDCLQHNEVPYPYFLPSHCNISTNM